MAGANSEGYSMSLGDHLEKLARATAIEKVGFTVVAVVAVVDIFTRLIYIFKCNAELHDKT